MVPFALLARRGCSTPCGRALALAAEFAPIRAERADLALDELSASLTGARLDAPETQLAANGIDDLLVDRVAVDGAGHPLLLAVTCAEAARRAGLALEIVAGPDGAFLAHRDLEKPLLVDPAAGALRDARTLAEPVALQCCHQVAARILNRIGERAERVGHVVWALRAAELRLALPFDGPTRERLERDLARIRARLN
jgi:transglutaminase superfamily protein